MRTTCRGATRLDPKITSHLLDTVFSQALWTLDPSTNARIAQVQVYALGSWRSFDLCVAGALPFTATTASQCARQTRRYRG